MPEIGKNTLISEIKKAVTDSIDLSENLNDQDIRESIIAEVFEKSSKAYMSLDEKTHIVNSVFNAMRRLDILQPIIDDRSVTEIMVNGPDNIFIEKDGHVSRIDLKFESREKLEDVIQSVVSGVNRSVNESSPIVDARLQDGSRVNIVLPPIALNGPILTIRKFPERPMTIEQLTGFGSLSKEAADFLCSLVISKHNIFIGGGTSSGKTTFLNALSGCIPKNERIITIEDSAELQINGIDNIVRMETRNANTTGKGEITIRDLIKTSLRMRPERIIIGEVRGPEALDMLQAMNTGHDGSISTGHANSAADMLSRLETMVFSGTSLPLDAVRRQIASALDIIIHLSRLRDRSRKVMEICEVSGFRDGIVVLNPLFVFEEQNAASDKEVCGFLKRTSNNMINTQKFCLAGIKDKI